jgi:hypothetical protein
MRTCQTTQFKIHALELQQQTLGVNTTHLMLDTNAVVHIYITDQSVFSKWKLNAQFDLLCVQ